MDSLSQKTTWKKVLRWMLTRNAVIYVLVFLLVQQSVDYRKIMLKTLDYLSTEPQYLIDFASGRDSGKAWRFRSACRYYQNLVRLFPLDKVYNALGFCHYHSGHKDLALRAFLKARELNQGLAGAIFNAGVIHFEKGEYPEAIAAFEKIATLAEKDRIELFREAISPGMQEMTQRHADSFELNRAVIIDNSANIHRYLAQAYLHIGNEPQMIKAALNAMSFIPDTQDQRAWACQVGRTLFSQGSVQNAQRFLRECVSGPDAKREDAETLARCFDKLGFEKEARNVRIQAVHLAGAPSSGLVAPVPRINPLYFYPPLIKTKTKGERGFKL